jgi:hypothetical protein
MQKKQKFKIFGFGLAVLALIPFAVQAQSLSLSSAKTSYNVGDSFQVSLSINTGGKIINTIEGVISVPLDKFQILDTRYGNSIISLWVERPTINSKEGIINFSGGVPGGFGGSNGPILSFSLKAKKAGSGAVSLEGIKVLLNDGLGTELKNISLHNLSLAIKEAPKPSSKPAPAGPKEEEKPVEVYLPPADTVPPESFIPLVSRNPGVADNKYFVSFFAVDKDSGISRYEITEKPLILSYLTSKFDKPWTAGESPYVLKGQWWAYKIIVRAYDQAGNYTDGTALKPFHTIIYWIFTGFLVITAIAITRFISRPRRVKK